MIRTEFSINAQLRALDGIGRTCETGGQLARFGLLKPIQALSPCYLLLIPDMGSSNSNFLVSISI